MRIPLIRSGPNPAFLYWMLAGWVVLNLFQIVFTGLLDDEALYWFHGQRLDWGYFEQAPFSGYLIRAGSTLFSGELGVRVTSLILSTLSIYLISRIAGVTNYLLYGALVFAVLIIHAGGFIATPDFPAMFFVVLFFMAYQHFLQKPSMLNTFLWGCTMAGIMYSKYNGVLVILLTVLSNIRLLGTPRFYLAVCSGILVFLPHLIWLIQHDFQTINFILFERSFASINHLVALKDYLLSVLLVFGPLMSVVLIWFTIARKPKDLFERGLKFSALGLLVFFLFYTFRGRVEGNWAAPAVVPMLILAYRSLESKQRLHKTIYILSCISLAFILLARIYLMDNFFRMPHRIANLTTLYDWDDWAKEIEDHAEGCPVVFFNSYQKASKYIFYTREQAVSLDSYTYHKTQFFYRNDIEREMQGKRVCILGFSPSAPPPDKTCYEGKIYDNTCYSFIDNFRSYFRVPLEIGRIDTESRASSVIPVNVRIVNPDPDTLRFDQNPTFPSYLVYHFYQDGKFSIEKEPAAEITHMVIPGSFADTVIQIRTPASPGNYLFMVSIQTGWLPPAKNTYYRTIRIQ